MTKQEFFRWADGKTFRVRPNVSRYDYLRMLADTLKRMRTQGHRVRRETVRNGEAIEFSNGQFIMLPPKDRIGTLENHTAYVKVAGIRVAKADATIERETGFATPRMTYTLHVI